MIEARNIYKTFRTPDRKEVKALVDFSTQINKGEVVVIIGPSGSGKSTFLRCLNRLEEIDKGEIIIDGVSIYDKERYLLQQEKERFEAEKAEQARKEEEIAQRQAMLEDIQAQLDQASSEEDSIMNIRYGEIAGLLESMKPVDAGKVMDNLPDYTAAKVLTKMRKREAGRVMNSMSPDKLAKVSQLITLLRD